MTAGQNLRVTVWHIDTPTDDNVGGAITTGSAVYTNVSAFMQSVKGQLMVGQQGLETLATFNMTIVPGTLIIWERDEVEITKPEDHPYYGLRFRIIGVDYSSHNPRDPRNYMMLTLTRSDRMHSLQ